MTKDEGRMTKARFAIIMATILFAQKVGAQTIETSNEEHDPMFDLNLKLDFQPKAAWVNYGKEWV